MFKWPIMRVEASMVMVGWEDGVWFLDGGEEGLEALLGVVVLEVVLGVVALGTVERRVWRRARAWAAVRVGEVVVGVWGGVGWAAISVLG